MFVGFLKTCCSHDVRELYVSLKIVQTTLEQTHFFRCGAIVKIHIREGVKKNRLFLGKVLNYGWVGVKSPKLVKM